MCLPLSKYFFIGASPAIKTSNCLLALLFSSKEASFSPLFRTHLNSFASLWHGQSIPRTLLKYPSLGDYRCISGNFPLTVICSDKQQCLDYNRFFSFFRCCSFPLTIVPIALLGCRRVFLFSFLASLSSIKCRLLISIDLAGSCPYFLYRWLYLCVYFSCDSWPLLKCVQYCCGST